MRFDEPLWLLLLLPIAFAWSRGRPHAIPFPFVFARHLRPTWRTRCDQVVESLPRLCAVALVVALSGPQFGRVAKTESSSGIDVQLLLDVSGSMQLRDLGANRTRLEVVRDVLEEFIAGRPGDRLGLMTFALYPRSVCPLTHDHDALERALAGVRPVLGNSAEDRTAIGVAIASAASRLAASTARSKILVMLTDGEQIVHDVSLDDAADYAAARGIRLYSVAAGRAQGQWTKRLASLSESTGGRAFFPRDEAALEKVYREIDALERSDAEAQSFVVHEDVHPAVQWVALVLLVLHAVLGGFVARSAP